MLQRAVKRSYSALRTPSNIETWDEHTLNRWLTARENKLLLVNVVPSISRLENLLRVLPTRRENDFGTHEILSQVSPKPGDVIHPGHHLVRQPLSPHARLRPDGSPTIQAPPVPWTRRHWAGGTLQFSPQPLLAGLGFVRGKVEVTKEAIQPDIAMPEEDEPFHSEPSQYGAPEYVAHEWLPIVKIVQRFITAQWYPQYLPLILEVRNTEFHAKGFDRSNVKVSTLIPSQSGILSFAFYATPFLLSTFCTIGRETHRIHSDLDYAKEEGYPDLVIPVQLQLILMLDTIGANLPDGMSIKEIQYEVVNPLFANHEIRIYRHHWLQGLEKGSTNLRRMLRPNPSQSQPEDMKNKHILLWTSDENGVVGIAAKVFLRPPQKLSKDWSVGTAKGCVVYTKGVGSEELDLQILEDDDRRVLAETLTLLNDPQGDPLAKTIVPGPSSIQTSTRERPRNNDITRKRFPTKAIMTSPTPSEVGGIDTERERLGQGDGENNSGSVERFERFFTKYR